MAFDAEGYRRAAMNAGIPKDVINQSIAERTGTKGWLTGGKSGIGGVVNAVGEVLNLPSYAVGGMLNRTQQAGQAFNPTKNPFGIPAAIEGIRNKTPVMTELPETFGIDPTSTGGRILGFAGELATPDPVGMFSDAYKALRGVGAVDDVGMVARGAQNLGEGLIRRSDDVVTSQFKQPALVQQIGRFGDESAGQVIKRLGLESGDPQAARQLKSKLIKQFNKLGLDDKKLVQVDNILKSFDDEIARQSQLAANGSQVAAQTVDALKLRRKNLVDSITDGQVSVGGLTQLKRAAGSDVPQSMIGLGQRGTGVANAAEFARKQFQKGAISGNKQLETIGLDLRRLGGSRGSKGLIDLFERAQSRSATGSPVKLTDLASIGAGGVVGGPAGSVGTYVAKNLLNSPRGIRAQSSLYETVGKQLSNPSNVNKINKAARNVGKAAKTGFRVSQQPNRSRQAQSQSQSQYKVETPQQNGSLQSSLDPYEEIRKRNNFSFLRR